jgi:hypothetical protein
MPKRRLRGVAWLARAKVRRLAASWLSGLTQLNPFPGFCSQPGHHTLLLLLSIILSLFLLLNIPSPTPTDMIRSILRPARSAFLSTSSAAQRRLASSLVFLEHKNGKLNDGSLSAVTAAKKLDGDAAGIVVGTKADVDGVLDQVKK